MPYTLSYKYDNGTKKQHAYLKDSLTSTISMNIRKATFTNGGNKYGDKYGMGTLDSNTIWWSEKTLIWPMLKKCDLKFCTLYAIKPNGKKTYRQQ